MKVPWLVSSLLVVLSVLLPFFLFKVQTFTQARIAVNSSKPVYYFYNEVTGEVQWEDPGSTPYEDENGGRYWIGPDGERMQLAIEDLLQYVWIEQYSEELKRPYFYNQETKESQWDRPPDLAWRRIRVHGDTDTR